MVKKLFNRAISSCASQAPRHIDDMSAPGDGTLKAILGPTNTGKTHLAIERMCAHSSGVIGLPLRLLARGSSKCSPCPTAACAYREIDAPQIDCGAAPS